MALYSGLECCILRRGRTHALHSYSYSATRYSYSYSNPALFQDCSKSIEGIHTPSRNHVDSFEYEYEYRFTEYEYERKRVRKNNEYGGHLHRLLTTARFPLQFYDSNDSGGVFANLPIAGHELSDVVRDIGFDN